MSAILDHLNEMYDLTPVWVTVLHGRFAEKAEELAKELEGKLDIAKLEVMRI